MTPDEEYAHYAAPEGQTPQGVPLRRHEPWSEPRVVDFVRRNRAGEVVTIIGVQIDDEDAFVREARKPCAACGHVQFLHCDDHDDPCGCIPSPRDPDPCQCKQFVDPGPAIPADLFEPGDAERFADNVMRYLPPEETP